MSSYKLHLHIRKKSFGTFLYFITIYNCKIFFIVTHIQQHQQQQPQHITVATLQGDHYNTTIANPTTNSPTIVNNTYYAAGTVAASAAAAALAAAGGPPPQTATIANHNNAQPNTNPRQGGTQQPKPYTTGRRRNSTLPTSSTGKTIS